MSEKYCLLEGNVHSVEIYFINLCISCKESFYQCKINLNILKIYLVFENCNTSDELQNTTVLTTENHLHVPDTDC